MHASEELRNVFITSFNALDGVGAYRFQVRFRSIYSINPELNDQYLPIEATDFSRG